MQDFASWRDELLALSDIPQDDDESVPVREAERRFNRFVQLVDQVQSDDPDTVFLTLMETLKDQDDYGAYEGVFEALLRLSPARRGRVMADGVLPLLRRAPDLAGDVLSQVAFDTDEVVAAFNRACAERATPEERRELSDFIAAQEHDGWLSHEAKRGRLRFT
jgi:hypothetical protein